jgi:hypothetical protein
MVFKKVLRVGAAPHFVFPSCLNTSDDFLYPACRENSNPSYRVLFILKEGGGQCKKSVRENS